VRSVRDTLGAGAAGGLAFALKLIGAEIMPGADFIFDTAKLNETMQHYDWVLTGEGQSDAQTLLGKAPALLAKRAREHQVPVSLLSGAIDSSPMLDETSDGCFSIMNRPESLRYAMDNAHALLEAKTFHAAKLFAAARRRQPGSPPRLQTVQANVR
jgi:glycerate kinase